jgi:methylmalonyl-CoA/ethylmalonyl-CoA epimerase
MASDLTGVLQVAIPVKDIERATVFYRDTLGLRFLLNGPNAAFFDCGGIRIYLDANPGTVQGSKNSMIYFRTEDLERAHSRFQERGVTIHQSPHIIASLPDRDVWLMWIADSEQNLLGVMQERPK